LRELPDELRPAGHGAVALLGFLAYLPFSSRFAGLSDVQRAMYLTAVVLAALAAVMLLLAPAACHCLAPGRPAEQAVRAARRTAVCGLAAVGLAVAAGVRLASRMVESTLAADLLGGGTAVFFLALWFVVPRLLSSGPPAARPPGNL
jgi:hypothetical protein